MTTQPAATEALDYDGILKLFANRHSADLADRHVAALEKVLRHNKDGFMMSEILYIRTLIAYCRYWLAEGNNSYLDCTLALVRLAATPLRKRKVSDAVQYAEEVERFLETIGSLSELDIGQLQIVTAMSLYDCLQENLEKNLETMASSGVVRQLVLGSKLATDRQAQFYLTRTLLALSKSTSCCEQIIESQGAALISEFLGTDDERFLSVVVELLWNLLEAGHTAHQQLDNADTISILKDQICVIGTNGRQLSKQLRNELVVLATILASGGQINAEYWVDTEFLDNMLSLASSTERGVAARTVAVQSTACDTEEFELKKLLFNLIFTLSREPSHQEVVIRTAFVPFLFMYLNPEHHDAVALRWTAFQFRDLQLQVLSLLFHFAAELPYVFSDCNGCKVVLDFIVANKTDAEIPHKAVKVLLQAARFFQSQLGAIGAIAVMLTLVSNALMAVKLRRDAALTLAAICRDDKDNCSEFASEGGIATLIGLLSYSPSDPDRQPSLVSAAVDCIWSSVVGHVSNEATFLEREGIDALLDLLEVCPYSMQNQVLGCILDLMENPQAVQMVREWRSATNVDRVAGSTVLQCWIREQKELEVPLNDGVIVNMHAPLMSASAARRTEEADLLVQSTLPSVMMRDTDTLKAMPSTVANSMTDVETSREQSVGHSAVDEVLHNMRAKVFAFFCKYGFDWPMTAVERVHLLLAKQFMQFKVGEVWKEIEIELKTEYIRPVSPDGGRISKIESNNIAVAQRLRDQQVSTLQQQKKADLDDETRVYNEIMRSGIAAAPKPPSVPKPSEGVPKGTNSRASLTAKRGLGRPKVPALSLADGDNVSVYAPSTAAQPAASRPISVGSRSIQSHSVTIYENESSDEDRNDVLPAQASGDSSD